MTEFQIQTYDDDHSLWIVDYQTNCSMSLRKEWIKRWDASKDRMRALRLENGSFQGIMSQRD